MNLLTIQDELIVSKTSLSRKLTIGGVTKAYPVYRVRLDQLFYNDQNDRIATWITQYKNDIRNVSFSELSREEYNKIIERFIIDIINKDFYSTVFMPLSRVRKVIVDMDVDILSVSYNCVE